MAERTLLQQRAGAHLLRRPGRAAGRRRHPHRGRPHRRGVARTAPDRRQRPRASSTSAARRCCPACATRTRTSAGRSTSCSTTTAWRRRRPADHALDVAAVVRTFLESGYTLVIGAGVLHPADDVLAKDAIDRGLIPGPRIVPSGPMITEPGALGADDGLMEVAADAARDARRRRAPMRRRRARAQAVHLRRQHRARVPVRRRRT